MITTLSLAQIVVLFVPVKAGNTFSATVTVESHPLAAPPAITSVPVGLLASYTVPFTVTLSLLQIVLFSVPVTSANTFKFTVTVESQPFEAPPKAKKAKGLVIESKLEKGKGTVSTVLIQDGTLKVGDNMIVGPYSGRVK